MRGLIALFPLALAACGGQPAAPAAPQGAQMVRVSLPDDPAVTIGGSDPALIETRCLACHSVEMITTQPRLPVEKWAATIEKMRTVYGAQIAKADEPALVAALQSAQR
ncbi:MAG TPA: cytochrome C nitrite reductase [Sphingomonas sp.]|nr:cytochrome C nitrite reductase [Sphingomonas sp.]